jgi:methyltransferase
MFLVLVGLVGIERLFELVLSTRNARRALARGGVEAESRGFYAAMVATHAAFLVAAPIEVFHHETPFRPALGWPMLALVVGAMGLRYWAVATLGRHWNTRVIVVPGEPAVVSGPYRHVRHPNYVAVAVEMFALPLVHSAWRTALVFSALDALLLWRRIGHEEAALRRHARYDERLGDRGRFLPGARRSR